MIATHPLRAFRAAHHPHLGQDAFAVMLGVSKATVSRWEAGKRFPSREHWPRIRELTGLGPEELAQAGGDA